MKIVLNGLRVMRGYECDYFNGVATFTKRGLNRRNVLHELYHHLVEEKKLEISEKREEKEASLLVREVMNRWAHND